jgi:hypothetical protein
MVYKCEICEQDPSSHSLKKLGSKNGITYFYTRPSSASKYNDVDGILKHYDGVLSENTESWIWVFDCKGFDMKHLMEIKVGICLAKLSQHFGQSQKFSHNLQNILIVNPTWHVKTVLDLVSPFLNMRMKSLITQTIVSRN